MAPTDRNALDFDMQNMRTCARCGVRYDWRRSASSSLKMTYCGSLCECGDLGFTVDALLHMKASSMPDETRRVLTGVDIVPAQPRRVRVPSGV